MPALKPVDHPEEYKAMNLDGWRAGDKSYCAVVAVALLANLSFNQANKLLIERGRKERKGTQRHVYFNVLRDLGFKLKRIDLGAIIKTYPAPHCNVLKNVTTHHPRRFPGSFDPNKRYLIQCRTHVAVMIGGQIKDWSINSALRVEAMYEVE